MEAARFTAFDGARQIASGPLAEVAQAVARHGGGALIFDDASGAVVDLDPRLAPEQAAQAYLRRSEDGSRPVSGAKTRGRPRLGVVAREVTLLPRHWDWLSAQPGGASAALRRLVEGARRASGDADRARAARDALYRAMSALAGDLPAFEAATRALFVGDDAALDTFIAAWPADIAAYMARLAATERAARSAA